MFSDEGWDIQPQDPTLQQGLSTGGYHRNSRLFHASRRRPFQASVASGPRQSIKVLNAEYNDLDRPSYDTP